jgi:hypothetical protein
MDRLADIRARAVELEHRIDQAPDEATARATADKLHALLDDLDNVAELSRPDLGRGED